MVGTFYSASLLASAGFNLIEIIPKELKASDIELMQLYARDELKGKKDGTVVNWTNEATSNFGSVELLKHFDMDGKNCKEVQHHVQLNANADNFSLKSVLCEDSTGEWYNVQR
tara:strand:+ start:19434 stop:19772 length:339 start_codon:yes stop_codon:yes gene_type:complete